MFFLSYNKDIDRKGDEKNPCLILNISTVIKLIIKRSSLCFLMDKFSY